MTTRARLIGHYTRRVALVAFLAILVLGSVAPFINASAFSGRIERALEASFGRKFTFTAVHFSLFSGPGFTLTGVTIQEEPDFGLEPFAYVPKLQVRLRLDRLLLGHIAVSSLLLVEPSLNLVKRNDGMWNVLELGGRLSAPTRLPIDLFPALQISEGRIDFKLGSRKTIFYITDSDLSVYPQRSGKLYLQFSGSPARTDRAGNGFGHLHGTANWYLQPAATDSNQLEADVTLDPSNLSELTTLFEGEDAGVHGMVSSHARIEGPASALRLSGDLHLADLHRWDLLPSSGQDLRIQYQGQADLVAHKFNLETVPGQAGETLPVALRVRINNLVTNPTWTLLATLNKLPVDQMLPVGKRMGFMFPDGVGLAGTVDGVVGYSSARQLQGGLSINDLVATLPNTPPLRAANVTAAISTNQIHIEPAMIETTGSGTLRVGGDYDAGKQDVRISLAAVEFPMSALKNTFATWFSSPASLEALQGGRVTGQIVYGHSGPEFPSWSGRFRFAHASLAIPELAKPLTNAQGSVDFDESNFNLDQFSAEAGDTPFTGSYQYNADAKRPEHLRLNVPSTSLEEIEAIFDPVLRAQGLLARLGVAHRTISPWLLSRNLQGDVTIAELSIQGNKAGTLRSRVLWHGTNIQFPSLQLTLPQGEIQAAGDLNIAANLPRYHFKGRVSGFPWRGGIVSADGQCQTTGTGATALQNLRASGTFSGQDLNVSAEDLFNSVSGNFLFTFADGWPDLRVSNLQAAQGDDSWTGEAASQSDGKLVIDLERPGEQRRVVSTLRAETDSLSSSFLPSLR